MVLGNKGLSCFMHTVEVPSLVLLTVCALSGVHAFETLNEDLLRNVHILECVIGIYTACVLEPSMKCTMSSTHCLLFLINRINSKQIQSMMQSLGKSRTGLL